MTICPRCGSIMPDHAKFCGKCGADMTETPKSGSSRCEMCGRAKRAEDRFCPVCGYDTTGQGGKAQAPVQSDPIPAYAPAPSYPPPAPQYQPPPAASTYGYQQPVVYAPPARNCNVCMSTLAPNQQTCPYCGARALSFNRKDRAGSAGGMIIAAAVINALIFGMAFAGSLLMTNPTEMEIEFAIIFGVMAFLNVIAIWGGMQAINRRRYTLAIFSSVITIFGLLFFLGIIAIIFLALSKESFVDQPASQNVYGNQGGRY